MPINDIFPQISNPRETVHEILGLVNRQLAWNVSHDAGGESFFTVSGARLNTKPMIIGFLPPDGDVNFIPIDRRTANVGEPLKDPAGNVIRSGGRFRLPGAATKNNKGGNDPGWAYDSVAFDATGHPIRERLVVKKGTSFTTEELRESLGVALEKKLGHPPSETLLCLVYGQTNNEMRCKDSRCGTNNFNLGGIHACPTCFKPLANPCVRGTLNPTDNSQLPDSTPSNGLYYAATDSQGIKLSSNCPTPSGGSVNCANRLTTVKRPDGRPIVPRIVLKGQGLRPEDRNAKGDPIRQRCWRSVFFRAYTSLDEGAAEQINTITRTWPNALNASNSEEYTEALLDGTRGEAYFDRTVAGSYQKGIERGCNRYQEEFGVTIPEGGPDGVNAGEGEGSGEPQVMKASSNALNITDTADIDQLINQGQNIEQSQDKERVEAANRQTAALQLQLDIFKTIPPLILLINPTEFTRDHENLADNSIKSRQGMIPHVWLEQPLSLTASGVTAAQYVVRADGTGGLTHHKRIHSLSYLNLMSMVEIYKNNGMTFTGKEAGDGNSGIGSIPMSVYIYYDGHLYIGSFDDFEIGDSGEKPYNMDWGFKFTVRYDMSANLSPNSQPSPPPEITTPSVDAVTAVTRPVPTDSATVPDEDTESAEIESAVASTTVESRELSFEENALFVPNQEGVATGDSSSGGIPQDGTLVPPSIAAAVELMTDDALDPETSKFIRTDFHKTDTKQEDLQGLDRATAIAVGLIEE